MIRRYLGWAPVALCTLLLLLMSPNIPVSAAPEEAFERTAKHFETWVGPEGAICDFGGVTLEIPAGALEGSQRITADVVRPRGTHGKARALSETFDLGPDRIRFGKPVRIHFRVNPRELPDMPGARVCLNRLSLTFRHGSHNTRGLRFSRA